MDMAGTEEKLKALTEIGLTEQKAKETIKNVHLADTLLTIIREVRVNYLV